jgi:hypothetical protein
MTETAKCACGAEARIHQTNCENYYVTCNKDDVYCWEGPVCPSESEAVAAWNGVMRARPVVTERVQIFGSSRFCLGKVCMGMVDNCGDPWALFDEVAFSGDTFAECRAWLIAKLTAAGFDVRTEGK